MSNVNQEKHEGEGGKECDAPTHLIKTSVFSNAARVTKNKKGTVGTRQYGIAAKRHKHHNKPKDIHTTNRKLKAITSPSSHGVARCHSCDFQRRWLF